MNYFKTSALLFLSLCTGICRGQDRVNWWLTTNDQNNLLSRQEPLTFQQAADAPQTIIIDPAVKYQEMDGFGFALTGGSALHMSRMSADKRSALIHELFGNRAGQRGISYLRLSIGSSDLNDHTYSYDDLPEGQIDPQLQHFSLKEDEAYVLPVLKEILAVNPGIHILGSPWSAPIWMKTNHNIQGGMLQEKYYPAYAQYFVKYIQAMKAHGVNIEAITVQNEPFNDGNTPSMQFLAKQEARFIKNDLGPAFEKAGIQTKIILYDHNCDAPEYPISILTDPEAGKYADGSGFHLYAGPITALSKVHDAFPDKDIYFTEMMAVSHTDFNTARPAERIVIGAVRNWSKNVILWNLANNEKNEPHTDNGGCSMCQGAITIEGDEVSRNLAYYTIGHFSEFVPSGSVHIKSTSSGEQLANAAFLTPDHHLVVVVANNSQETQEFNIQSGGKAFHAQLPPAATATYTW